MSARLKRGSGALAPSDTEATPSCDVQALLEEERCAVLGQLDRMVGAPSHGSSAAAAATARRPP